jgi:RNA polymerase sigma-70 factor (ECF subfamily)
MATQEKGSLRLLRGDAQKTAPAAATALSDAELVAGVAAGNDDVASELCVGVMPQIDRTIRRLLGHSDAEHEDIAQLCLIEIINTIRRYRGDCALDRWVQSVTAHVVFKHLRRRRLERRLFTGLLSEDGHPGPVSLDRAAVTRAVLSRIAGHLDRLASPRAWAFLLHDGLGYDLTEIAEMTDCSVAAAQSRLSRGRRDLHERISNDPELSDLLRIEEDRE